MAAYLYLMGPDSTRVRGRSMLRSNNLNKKVLYILLYNRKQGFIDILPGNSVLYLQGLILIKWI